MLKIKVAMNLFCFFIFLILSSPKSFSAALLEEGQGLELNEILIIEGSEHEKKSGEKKKRRKNTSKYLDLDENPPVFKNMLKKWSEKPRELDEDEREKLCDFLFSILKKKKGQIHKEITSTKKYIFKILTAFTLVNIAICTGMSTFIHEYLGHLELGGRMIYEGPAYESKEGIDYEVFSYQQMRNVKNFKDFLNWFFHLENPHKDMAGFAMPFHNRTGFSPLGTELGEEQSMAWVSIAGPITYAIAIGAIMLADLLHHQNYRKIAFPLFFLSCSSILANTSYAWSVLAYTSEEKIKKAVENGHDFASFSSQLSRYHGVTSSDISYLTIAFFTLIPLYNICWFDSWLKRGRIDSKPSLLQFFYKSIAREDLNSFFTEEVLRLEESERLKIYESYSKEPESHSLELRSLSKLEKNFVENLPVEVQEEWAEEMNKQKKLKDSYTPEFVFDTLALLSLFSQYFGLGLQIAAAHNADEKLREDAKYLRLGEIALPAFNLIRTASSTHRLWHKSTVKSHVLNFTELSLHLLALSLASNHFNKMQAGKGIYSFATFFEDIFLWQVVLSIESIASIIRKNEYKEPCVIDD